LIVELIFGIDDLIDDLIDGVGLALNDDIKG
jgi:hypothetical protein